jgi:hypothetical protein
MLRVLKKLWRLFDVFVTQFFITFSDRWSDYVRENKNPKETDSDKNRKKETHNKKD